MRVASTAVPTLSSEFVVDELQDAWALAVLFKPIPEAHNAHSVGNSIGTARVHKGPLD
jgi:hypothetical protein